MESATPFMASRSLLLPLSVPISRSPAPEIARNGAHSCPSTSSSASLKYHRKSSRILLPYRAVSDLQPSKTSPELGLLLEVEGVIADIYRLGNRQAFNVAFQKLGLDCANWTEPVYADLTRKASGDEERMLVLFFNRIGWPTALPTNEKGTFTKSVLREKGKALGEFAASANLLLRPGVETFIDDALKEGIPVVVLTAYSKNGDKISRSIIEKLGHDRISKIKIVGKEEVEGSFYGQLVLGKGVSSSLEEQLAKEARKAVSMEKQKVAEEVASTLKLSVNLDTTAPESFDNIVITLRAGAECAGLPVDKCILIAGSQSGVLGADHISMPCVVLRSSLTARAEFRTAKAVMDGFGGADLTISKLRSKRW
ncbi:HAD-like protein [Dioscorea alata]|uniref:HAD-like protein n=1 Tax=Dioscorea alata TaxID=55571 RepID=A0ACB7UKN5_DIOAL|nr:HAD-like protein [Dioscorea alata]